MVMDIFAYIFKSGMDISVAVSQNFNSDTVQKSSAFSIVFFCVFTVVLRTVQFNNQFRSGTIKINDIVIEDFLSYKSNTEGLSVWF